VKHDALSYIPFKSNTSWRQCGAPIWKFMYRYFVHNRSEVMQYYHQRSNVESTISMMKRKFGDHLRTKNDIAMSNEILCKSLVHNICVLIQEMFTLGIKIDFQQDSPRIFCAKSIVG
jgi:transposase